MVTAAFVGVAVLLVLIVYVVFRKFSFTQHVIEFAMPQNGVAALYLSITEDEVRSLHILYEDGTMAEVWKSGSISTRASDLVRVSKAS